jgi:hypothetical protein
LKSASEKQILLLSNKEGESNEDNNINITELEGNDPFDMNEPDPAKCNALQSSLWEITAI